MLTDLLRSHLRMRASLVAILDLDPPGIGPRIAEMDAEIARLRSLIETEDVAGPAGPAVRPALRSGLPGLKVA